MESPSKARSIALRGSYSASLSNNASTASVVLLREPLGHPEGLPLTPFVKPASLPSAFLRFPQSSGFSVPTRFPSYGPPHKHAPIAQADAIHPDRFDGLAGEPPNETRRRVEQVAGRPSRIRRVASPGVEKSAAIIELEPPFGVRHVRQPLRV